VLHIRNLEFVKRKKLPNGRLDLRRGAEFRWHAHPKIAEENTRGEPDADPTSNQRPMGYVGGGPKDDFSTDQTLNGFRSGKCGATVRIAGMVLWATD
jgi:hypothetical protein